MLRQKTAFVIGAGASCELGLPSGDGLKSSIVKLLTRSSTKPYVFADDRMVPIIKDRFPDGWHQHDGISQSIQSSAARICRGLPLSLSIDNFLHSHSGDEGVTSLGKVAIAQVILQAERQSKLFKKPNIAAIGRGDRVRPSSDTEGVSDTWYIPVVQLLFSGINVADIGAVFANATFIIFNYDRCFEQYLWSSLQAYFDITPVGAAQILANVEFIHPYGSLGPLPWQVPEGEPYVELGQDGVKAWDVGARLRTFTESVESEVEPRIKSAIAEAETILILGFGYLDQNVRLLMPMGDKKASRIISTALGVSVYDQAVIRDTMANLCNGFDPDIFIELGPCKSLFENFRLTLSLQ